MTIFKSAGIFRWGELDVPLLGAGRDWFGKAVEPLPGYCVAVDPERWWLVAMRRGTARLDPDSRAGGFRGGLWRWDVAELFLGGGDGRYLELNLAPNGAWWSCGFRGPRVADDEVPLAGVESHAAVAEEGGWLAALSVPRQEVERVLGGEAERGNVCFIVDEPQRFVSVSDLGGGEPDFHRPEAFPKLEWRELPAL